MDGSRSVLFTPYLCHHVIIFFHLALDVFVQIGVRLTPVGGVCSSWLHVDLTSCKEWDPSDLVGGDTMGILHC